MTKTLDKTELVRLAWLTELRRQGHRQCEGHFTNNVGGVCALGLLAEVAGVDAYALTAHAESSEMLGAVAGMNAQQTDYVVSMNDGDRPVGGWRRLRKHTFAEIADVVEGWFK